MNWVFSILVESFGLLRLFWSTILVFHSLSDFTIQQKSSTIEHETVTQLSGDNPLVNISFLLFFFSKYYVYTCRQVYFTMDQLVWLRNPVGQLTLLLWKLLKVRVVSSLMTQIWDYHYGHLLRLLEIVLWVYGTKLTLLRYMLQHIGPTPCEITMF